MEKEKGKRVKAGQKQKPKFGTFDLILPKHFVKASIKVPNITQGSSIIIFKVHFPTHQYQESDNHTSFKVTSTTLHKSDKY